MSLFGTHPLKQDSTGQKKPLLLLGNGIEQGIRNYLKASQIKSKCISDMVCAFRTDSVF